MRMGRRRRKRRRRREEIRCVCMNLPGKPDGIEWQNL
jgi:hypothetical protein